jgi:hypothetical protein
MGCMIGAMIERGRSLGFQDEVKKSFKPAFRAVDSVWNSQPVRVMRRAGEISIAAKWLPIIARLHSRGIGAEALRAIAKRYQERELELTSP